LRDEIVERIHGAEILQRAQAELAEHAAALERRVAERTAELTEINQQLETFVYSVAHDLRAPLRAMQGFSQLLLDSASSGLDETAKGYAARIDKAAQFMDALLCDLLAFSRIAQRNVELTAVSLQGVVEHVLARLQPDIEEKHACVTSPGPWPQVLAHEPTLEQVLFNLASNALKFNRPGVPPLLRIRAEERADFIRVWVEDNGLGIAPEHREQIFRVFLRLHGEKYAGTGIGLAIVQKGLQRMDGRVGLCSGADHGSSFWFELRRA
jgi:signal transduction histidine kinase